MHNPEYTIPATMRIGSFEGFQIACSNQGMNPLVVGSLSCGSRPKPFLDGLNGHTIVAISHENDLDIPLLKM
jgi:hypothetical protein